MGKNNYLLASSLPPKNFPVNEVPMFVCFGFDDNGIASQEGAKVKEGVRYISHTFASFKNYKGKLNKKTFDNETCSCTFFNTTKFLEDDPKLGSAWLEAKDLGHEIGIHTHNHLSGNDFGIDQWKHEISLCIEMLKSIGLDDSSIKGFRSPFLGCNNDLFEALKSLNLTYDCSIVEGHQYHLNGENFYWPYTLDEGSPGQIHNFTNYEAHPIFPHEGLWEIPVQVLMVPPDSLCEKYNIRTGYRRKLEQEQSYYSYDEGKILAFDYNCLNEYKMGKKEFLGLLKYNFDLRYYGNRAPFTFGAHSDFFSKSYDRCPNISFTERCEVLEEFLSYVLLHSGTRVVSFDKLVSWLQEPKRIKK